MTGHEAVYTWDEVESSFVRKAAWWGYKRYSAYGVSFDDVTQEVNLWLWGSGKKKVEKWLSLEPQRTTRIYMSLLEAARKYGEAEKAASLGYEVDDLYWYTPAMVETLMPYAKKADWAGETNHAEATGRNPKPLHERGDFLAMVMDVRRALKAGYGVHQYDEIADFLSGTPAFTGSRKVLSNAQAVALTRGNDE